MRLCEEYDKHADTEQIKNSGQAKRVSILRNEESKKDKIIYAKVSFRKDFSSK